MLVSINLSAISQDCETTHNHKERHTNELATSGQPAHSFASAIPIQSHITSSDLGSSIVNAKNFVKEPLCYARLEICAAEADLHSADPTTYEQKAVMTQNAKPYTISLDAYFIQVIYAIW